MAKDTLNTGGFTYLDMFSRSDNMSGQPRSITLPVSVILALVIGLGAGFSGGFVARPPLTTTQSIFMTETKTDIRAPTSTVTAAAATREVTVTASVEVQLVCFSRTDRCDDDIIRLIDQAKTSAYIMIFSFTSDSLGEAVIRAKNRGLDVRVVIDNMQAAGLGGEFGRLRDNGVLVRTDTRVALMHHKVAIIDGEIVITGSYNWSAAAENDNDENLIIIRDSNLAKQYTEEFTRIWAVAS